MDRQLLHEQITETLHEGPWKFEVDADGDVYLNGGLKENRPLLHQLTNNDDMDSCFFWMDDMDICLNDNEDRDFIITFIDHDMSNVYDLIKLYGIDVINNV